MENISGPAAALQHVQEKKVVIHLNGTLGMPRTVQARGGPGSEEETHRIVGALGPRRRDTGS